MGVKTNGKILLINFGKRDKILMIKIVTNSDKNLVKEIRKKIKENNGHCACAIALNDDNLCMCKEFREQIADGVIGECGCGLYVVIENK